MSRQNRQTMTNEQEYKQLQDRLILIMSGQAPKSGKGAMMRRLKVLWKELNELKQTK